MDTALFLLSCCWFVGVSTATSMGGRSCQVYQPCHVEPKTIPNGIVARVMDPRHQVALAFNCNKGFVLQGKAVLTCCDQNWEDIFPKCAPLDCKAHYDSGNNSSGVYIVYPAGQATPKAVYCDMNNGEGQTGARWPVEWGFSALSGAQGTRDCKGHYDSGITTSGVYMIYPGGQATLVFCDMTGQGGGWTVIQRRKDASVNFNRKWADYKAGFGHVNANFWIGLDNLHDLTSATDSEIYIYMNASSSESAFARYSTFGVAGEADNYRLSVAGYSGTAGDSLVSHNNAMFSTFDADHDTYSANCAVEFTGAWWYTSCHSSNPNGLYLNGAHPGQYAQGIEWSSYKGQHHSMIYFEMKIRRKI